MNFVSAGQLETVVKVAEHERRPKPLTDKNLPRRIEIIPVSEEKKWCPCGVCKNAYT